MLDHSHQTSSDLFGIIAHVRTRWRLKLALRGAACVLGVAFVLFLIAAYGMEWLRFTTASIIASRVLLAVAFAASVYWFLVRPLRRHVSDEQVALYLEEHEPALDAMLVSAVEASRASGGDSHSEALVRKVVEQALDAVVRMDAARKADMEPLRRYGAAVAGVALVALLAILVGPAFLRHAASALLLVSRDIEAAVPYKIEVTPGNATVPKGADQKITAKLIGFGSEDVALMVKRTPTSEYEELPLLLSDSGTFEGLIFDVAAPLEYYVIADRTRGGPFTLKVVDLPYVQRLDLEYRYPSYTGLEVETVEDGGDIAVLRGTDVRLRITSTMKTPGGRIALNEKETIPLTLEADGTLTAGFKATTDGFYRVELDAPNGERVAASPEFTIDILEDRAPTVTFRRPGRDTSVSPIEELFIEASAEDDYGVRNLELVYSVNGGEEKTVRLFAGDRRLAEVSAGHTFYLEEMSVQPGDAVSYYARAVDNDAVGGAKTAMSDLYFLRVRPFRKDFRQAQSQGGGGGGGGGGGNQVEALSEQQKQIISATFNVNRDRKRMTADKLRENSRVVGLNQAKLREQVEGLITRMNSELIQRDPAFEKIGEMLPQAVAAMKDAEAQLMAGKPEAANKPEQQALQILQKAEEEYETQIQVSRQQGGGGGGGGGGAMQQELAELFEQELDQMASRYETQSQASEQQGDREVDELLEKLKELARRTEQAAESQRRLQAIGQQGGGASSAQQRALADQIEEIARRLERLSREEQRQEVAEAARAAQEAADQLRRAAAGDAQATARAQQALERLNEAQRGLQRNQQARTQQEIQEAQRRAAEIARRQQEIQDQTRQLPQGAGRQQAARRIQEEKQQLDQQLGQLESQLDRAARDASRDERAASRKLAEAAGEIRDQRLRDQVNYSANMVGSPRVTAEQLAKAEQQIAAGIEDVQDRLAEAQAALGQGQPGDRQQNATDQARRVARNAESLAERTREAAERAQQGRGQQGQQGREGQEGQQGQGQQGQQGQGQQGQQGQGQQGQQGQGQQGQQGQGQGQGQRGQQGQGQQGGQNGGGNADGRLADGRTGGFDRGGLDRGGVWNGGWGGWWDGFEGTRLSPEDIRQFQNEARRLLEETGELRNAIRGVDIDPRELEDVMRRLRELTDNRVYQNVAELARLQTQVAEGMKRFEFGLRRETNADANALALSGSDESPEAYRKQNDEYFRSLAKAPK